MDYTIRNLSSTTDLAPQFGFGDNGEAHFPRDELDVSETGLAYLVLKPGRRSPFGHRHEDAEEVYVVISGDGRMRLDDEIVEIGALDAIRVAPKIARAFEAGPEGITVLAFGARHEGDGEVLPDFWKG